MSILRGLELVRVSCVFGVDKASHNAFCDDYSIQTYSVARRAPTSKSYSYKALKVLGLQPGDLAVVSTPSYGLTVVTVKSVEDLSGLNHGSYKWVMAKIDIENTQKIIKRAEEARMVMAQLEAMAQEEKRKIDVRTILKGNKQAEALLERLEELSSLRAC